MKYLFLVLSIFTILGTLIPFLPSRHYLVQGWEFPIVQLMVIGTIGLIGSCFYYSALDGWMSVVIYSTAICLIYLGTIVYPYVPIAPTLVKEVQDSRADRRIKVLSSNVLIDNKETTKLKKLIDEYDPDVIALLEPDQYWADQMAYLKEEYTNAVEIPLDNAYGLLFYSRLPTEGTETRYVIEEGVPSVVTTVRLPSGEPVKIYCVHPKPPSPTENTYSSERDAELLIYGKEIADEEDPVIIFGDLNDVAWSKTTRLFQKISELMDPRKGRRPFHTFHADYWPLRWPLDHVFHSDDFKFVRMERLPRMGSDHFPIFIELEFQPSAAAEQEKPDATDEEEERANEIIEEGAKKPS